ncbi:MAG: sodium ion-translocating decarboxylase subunit beta [Saprospiraceae bacterium]
MKAQDKLYIQTKCKSKYKGIENHVPYCTATVAALLVPSSVPLVGLLLFGNLIKEIGSDTSRLFSGCFRNHYEYSDHFSGTNCRSDHECVHLLQSQTLMIIVGGFLAFAISIAGGILAVKVYNIFAKKKINPLIEQLD